jgi:hypothetical protein
MIEEVPTIVSIVIFFIYNNLYRFNRTQHTKLENKPFQPVFLKDQNDQMILI